MSEPEGYLKPPIFVDVPFSPKVGLALREYLPYIRKCLHSKVSLGEIHKQLVAIGYKHSYITFTRFVTIEITSKVITEDGYTKTSTSKISEETSLIRPRAEPPVNTEISPHTDLSDLTNPQSTLTALAQRRKQ